MKMKQNKIGTYLAVTAGVGCAASSANAAVTFYGVNSANDTNADPIGINFGSQSVGPYQSFRVDTDGLDESYFSREFVSDEVVYFTQGLEIATSSYGSRAPYATSSGGLEAGAVLGSNNYAHISFNGDDSTYEAVAQFYFDGTGGGYLIAIATTNAVPNPQDLTGVGGPALSISAGKALIDAASVPEPSSLALLALGSAGLVARRKRGN